MTTPLLAIAADCRTVLGAGWECQACSARQATGHVRLGGPVVMVVCRACAEEWRDYELAHPTGDPLRSQALRTIKIAMRLIEFAAAGHVDLERGGAGAAGYAPLWHGDHYDPMLNAEHVDS